MPSILNLAKPLLAPAGAIAKRLGVGGPSPKAGMNDQTLKAKVESTLYRVPGVSRSKVNVTVADGVVTVHGEARRPQMASIETAVRSVPEVKGFESQLHFPKTPAPSTPKAGQRQATKKKPAAATKAAARGRTERVSRDKTATAAKAEKTPAKKAAAGEGRTPAPLGSRDTGSSAKEPSAKTAGQSASAVAKVKSGDAS